MAAKASLARSPLPGVTSLATKPPVIHGEYLLFVKNVDTPDYTRPEAWVVRPDGTGLRKVVEGWEIGGPSPPGRNLETVVWSHDGGSIHVVKGCDSRLSDIVVGSWGEKPLITMGEKAASFVWSPDDGNIAYYRFTGSDVICMQNSTDDTHDLMAMKGDGSAQTVVVHNAVGYTEWWGHGFTILVRDGAAWSLVSIVDGASTPLVSGVSAVRLSPDGSLVAFIDAGHVKVRATSGGLGKLRDLGAGGHFAWSPDGKSIAVAGGFLKVFSTSTWTSSTPYALPASKPTWSPNSLKIAFITHTGGVSVLSVKGGPVTPVPGVSGVNRDLQWQP